jgi:hypothetical protein
MKFKFLFLSIFILFNNTMHAQDILVMDSCFGSWQIDSVYEFTEDFKSSETEMSANIFDSLVRIISIGTFTINANHTFTYLSGLKEFSIKNGNWRQLKKYDWIEISNQKDNDFSLMRFNIVKKEEIYFIEMQDLFIAKIKKLKQ